MERENSLLITFELNVQVMTEDTSTDEIIQRECGIKTGPKIDSQRKLTFNRQEGEKEQLFNKKRIPRSHNTTCIAIDLDIKVYYLLIFTNVTILHL